MNKLCFFRFSVRPGARFAAAALSLAALCAATALAGENDGIVTRYTASDYVQEGLLLHYDAIENVGAGQPHSSSATEWVNLGSLGGSATLTTVSGGDPGEWRADGYRFERESAFVGSAFTVPSNQTVQIAFEGNALDQDAYNAGVWVNEPYLYYANGTFQKACAVSLRRDNNSTGNSWIDWPCHGYTSGARPDPTKPVGSPFRYATAILADDYAAAFFGATIPTAATARWTENASRQTLTKVPTEHTATWHCIGGRHYGDTDRCKFRGVVHNFRLYNRVLTDDELALNRAIDDYRFHGAIPVTNIVVATSHVGLEGAERSNPYEISGSYTFTAPATATDARGIAYACTGYTLETWDDTAQCWGEPVSYESCSYAYSTTAGLVRLTWQWQATGALFTAADYDLTDYVAGGLLLHYDGLQNLGAESADSSNPTSAWSRVWNSVAPAGGNAALYQSTVGTEGSWSNDGFTFASASSFKATDGFVFSPKCTHQTLVDGVGDSTDNGGSLSGSSPYRGYVMYASPWNKAGSFSFVSDDQHSWIDLAAHGFTGGSGDTSRCDPCMRVGTNLTYATGIMGDGYMAAFYGTEIPSATTARWTNPSRLSTSHLTLVPSAVTAIYLGAANGGQGFLGTVKNYRYYDRVLTEAELARNRQVDSARYLGELAFTNVVVTAGPFAADPAPGAYAVEGSWTFTAARADGGEAPTSARVRTIDRATGEILLTRNIDAATWTYDAEAEGGALVEIEWRAANPFVLVVR